MLRQAQIIYRRVDKVPARLTKALFNDPSLRTSRIVTAQGLEPVHETRFGQAGWTNCAYTWNKKQKASPFSSKLCYGSHRKYRNMDSVDGLPHELLSDLQVTNVVHTEKTPQV